ncbi:MAG TPA: hypothetical protein PLW61_05995 [Caldisericia bacterium]|nr:hypothetical protein [Caldisericia bacterium]HPB34295.1 hypothetical protein [Caldisericia bacterium]HQN49203.1 hypothetical protein [Caldisericia bacterium]HQP00396.1 hypothetical protein [Caldisericia bacterium]HRT03872.1 hypothetical protein [Candidatus Diapherotrites archaeon]
MLDTLSIGTSEFDISRENKLIMRVDTYNETNTSFKKYFFNSEEIYLTIDDKGLRLHFSLPKLLYKNNFYPIKEKDFQIAIDNLDERIRDLGVITDLKSFKVMRLDIFKNVMSDYNFNIYSDILRSLELKRTHKRDYIDGFLSSNTNREICFYNKIKEMRENKERFTDIKEEKIIRGELRLLKHREVKKNNITLLKEIPDKWSDLKEVYKQYISEVFKGDMNGDIDKETIILEMIKKEKKKAFDKFKYIPLFNIERDKLKQALSDVYQKRDVYYILKKIDRDKKELGKYFKSLEYRKLYNEIKDKFLSEEI